MSLQVYPNLTPVNSYGPTEATSVTIHYSFPRDCQSVVIGRPDPNTHGYVVDSALRPVPVGVPGELLLSGPRLALGYAGQPELTAEKFVPNPCLELVSGRVDPALAPYYTKAYRTGDLVRWRGDGTLDFLGRIDRQVKITGVRIELGEVESALEGAEGVTQAVAAAVADCSRAEASGWVCDPCVCRPCSGDGPLPLSAGACHGAQRGGGFGVLPPDAQRQGGRACPACPRLVWRRCRGVCCSC